MQKPRLIIFDLDGTLLDTASDLACSVNTALQEVGLAPLDLDTIKSYIGNGSLQLIHRCLGQENHDLLPRAHSFFMENYRENCLVHTQPYPGVNDFLARNILPMALLTNKPMEPTKKLLDHFGWNSTFSCVLAGDTAPARKPAPDGILEIAKTLVIAPNLIWMVGDDLPDIEAAKAAGAVSIALSCGFGKLTKLQKAEPDMLIPHINVLLQMVHNSGFVPAGNS